MATDHRLDEPAYRTARGLLASATGVEAYRNRGAHAFVSASMPGKFRFTDSAASRTPVGASAL